MKIIYSLVLCMLSLNLLASVPTEEGLLKNLNNADLPGKNITIKMQVQQQVADKVLAGPENEKMDYVKLVLSLDNANAIGLLQVTYNNSQMQNSQIKDVKYIPDLLGQIRREKQIEKSMFYAVMMMLATNYSQGMEAFLEKNGVSIVKNKAILNEDKLKLLRAYRSFLINNKGRGDAGSPLNPEDPKNREQIVNLFRSNTFKRANNIELIKLDNEFMWKVDWKNIQGYFTNEERRFRALDYSTMEAHVKLEATSYLLFNGVNELPKYLTLKDSKDTTYKLQVLGLDNKIKAEKRLSDVWEDLKKLSPSVENSYSFLF